MNTVEVIHDDLKALVDRLKRDHPGWCITLGYIGNIWHQPTYCDDRSWRISMRPEGIMECWESKDSYQIGHQNDREDKSFVFLFDEENFFNWVERQKIRWNDYMLENFKNKMKGTTEKEVFMNMMERSGYFGKSRYYSDETYFYCLTRRNSYGKQDEYTFAKFEVAFDSNGNLIEIRASS